MTLNAILAALRHPKAKAAYMHDVSDIIPSAKFLRDGSERIAYTVGRYVVKKQNDRPKPPVKQLARVGVHPPTQWLVNGWVVQPRYRRLPVRGESVSALERSWDEAGLDLGNHNVGKDRWGRYVAFDW